MEKISFPWEEESEPRQEHPASISKWRLWWDEHNRRVLPILGLLLLLLILYLIKNHQASSTQNESPQSNLYVDVLVPLLPIAKGSLLEAQQLKQISVYKKDLTKTQLIELVMAEDLDRFKNHFLAKKDLPPRKPIFWTDLSIEKHSLLPSITPILFGE